MPSSRSSSAISSNFAVNFLGEFGFDFLVNDRARGSASGFVVVEIKVVGLLVADRLDVEFEVEGIAILIVVGEVGLGFAEGRLGLGLGLRAGPDRSIALVAAFAATSATSSPPAHVGVRFLAASLVFNRLGRLERFVGGAVARLEGGAFQFGPAEASRLGGFNRSDAFATRNVARLAGPRVRRRRGNRERGDSIGSGPRERGGSIGSGPRT